ncbi:MAG: ABC transporter permease [Rectinema subterraneum]|uniref:ABC transporter permease n=1 Tax=Rectinema subterraneum TaxID=2653714 RepID=UPI003C7E63ED
MADKSNGTPAIASIAKIAAGTKGAAARQKILAFSSLVLLIIAFSLLSPNFFQPYNLIAIMLATAVNGVLAIGVTFVIITGGIDLSVGTMMTFTAVMAAQTVAVWNLPVILGVLMALFIGTICGLASGVMIAKFKLPPFIATLGMSMLTKGLSLIIAKSKPIYFTNAPSFTKISMGSLFPFMKDFQIPNAVIILFGLAILASFVLNSTIFGRYTFAIGSNEEAVRLSGINTDRWKIAVYAVNGLICGIAGILIASRLNSAQPALGQGYELDAIAAAVIGGTSLSGGEGTILGTIIGAFIMSTLTNGLRILSVPQEWQIVTTGIIIIFAVYVDMLRKRR